MQCFFSWDNQRAMKNSITLTEETIDERVLIDWSINGLRLEWMIDGCKGEKGNA